MKTIYNTGKYIIATINMQMDKILRQAEIADTIQLPTKELVCEKDLPGNFILFCFFFFIIFYL